MMTTQLISMPEDFLATATDTVQQWMKQNNYLPAGLAAGALLGAVAMATRELQKQRKLKKLPPGPPGHWLSGNFKEIDQKQPLMSLLKWNEQYGDIYTMSIYSKPIVIINSEAGLREALVTKSNDFAGRPEAYRILYVMQDLGEGDMAFQDINPEWMVLKKCLINAFREVAGENLELLEILTQEYVAEMIDTFLAYEGKPFSPSDHIFTTISRIMFNMLFGRNITKESIDQLHEMRRGIFNLSSPLGNGNEIEAWPWLRFMNNPWFGVMKRARKNANEWIEREMATWKADYDPEHPRCVLDNMKRMKGTSEYINDNHLKAVTIDSIVGGVGTIQGSVISLLAFLGSYPEVQKKLQKEADEVLGSRPPTIRDKENMHYTQATLFELMRMNRGSGFPHKTMKDTSLCGFDIPKDTECWMLYWNLHFNEEYFPDAFKFIPDRFIDENGHFLPAEHQTRRRLLSFGAGRRICPGEKIAKDRLFLIIAMLMQRLTIVPPEGKTLPSDTRDFHFSITLNAPPYELCAIPRK